MVIEKILYENQDSAWEKASAYLIELVSVQNCVQEAFVWASLAEKKFGFYPQAHNGRNCSDIDLVIVLDERFPIPKEWKFTHVKKPWFDLYHLGSFNYAGNVHPIDGLLVSPSKHHLDRMRSALKGRSKKIYEKGSI